ncbi:prepilin-type N-terminal cleavage/methylation domain-containing protein [Candidatus Microgenomates bacterium]|nr:prepilin-type N-terminal cleavage/methylation domain-containing protein [Candidatus Microgenomates bacterium]
MVKLPSRTGYTLLELLVVLSVAGIVATMVFFGLGSYNNTDAVTNAQKEFINNLRAIENKVNVGADGKAVKWVGIDRTSGQYKLYDKDNPTGTVINVAPVTIDYSVVGATVNNPFSLCFINPNLTALDNTGSHACALCNDPTATGWVCDQATLKNPASLTVTFSRGSFQKSVVVEGSGMQINRIYAP